MAEIKNIYEDSARTQEIYPITHERAVIDNNGTTAETKFQMITDLVNQKQMAVGAVPSDLIPTKGSSDWVTSDGVYVYGTYYNEADLTNATYPSTIINGSGNWATVTGASSILIPVSSGDEFKVVGNGNQTGTLYAFVKSNVTTSGQAVQFATGYTERVTESGSATFYITAPSDATYLWFMFQNSSGSMMPSLYSANNIVKLKDELDEYKNDTTIDELVKVDSWSFMVGGFNGSSAKRASDKTLYYIQKGTSLTIPSGMNLVIQTFNEDGGIGAEISATSWLSGTYTFSKNGWYRFIARNTSDSNITSAQEALLSAMSCLRYTKDYPETRFKLFKMDRLTGKLIVYTHEGWIAPQSTTQTLNDRFFELDGKPLSMSGNSEFFLIFFDAHYERVSDTITTLGEWVYYITNYDYSNLGAKYVRIVGQKGNDYKNVNAIFTSGVKNNTCTSADVTVSVNSKTEIVADAADATGAIQQALFLAYIRGGKAILYEDDYILNSTTPWTDNNNAPKCCLWVPHIIDTISQYSNEIQFFTIEGTIQPVSYNHGVRIILGEDVYDNVTDELPLSVIRSEYQTKNNVIGTEGGVAAIALKNMNILLPNNQKAITTIDLRYTHACNIENLNTMAGYSTLNWGHTNTPPIANPNCVGIRGLIGANWSVLSTFTNIEAFGYYIGIDWCGEHITGRNISVKYNYYGMTFTVLHWYGHQGHPIVLMNVLDEHSVCLPKFGKAGADCHQMVNILGYNLMFPSEATQGDITAMDARHHKAVDDNNDKYAWNGFIYYTNANDQSDGSIVGHNIQDFSFFEKGGFNVRCVNTCNYRIASDASLALMEPNFLQEVWSRTHNKLCIFDGTNWKSADGEVIYEYPTYSLSGVVTSDGSPVSGASVKYTYQGVDYTTTTGSDGSYSLTVPQFAGVIEVSKSGYTTFGRRIKMTAATTLNIVLDAE